MKGAGMDLTTLTPDEFTDHERAVKVDRERRDNLARIPDTIAGLSRAYAASGGDPADLVDAVTHPPEPGVPEAAPVDAVAGE